MSMVGRKVFGQIDCRLRQAFPHRAQEVFGGCSLLLFGFWSTATDLPTDTRTAFILTQVMRQAGNDPSQVQFRNKMQRLQSKIGRN